MQYSYSLHICTNATATNIVHMQYSYSLHTCTNATATNWYTYA